MLKIGDIVYLPGAYRTHGAYIEIVKINRRSVRGIERQGSYRPGQDWSLGMGIRLDRQTYSEVKPFVTSEWFVLGENGEML